MSWRVQPGQAIAIPSGEPHAYGAKDDNPWTIYWVHMAGTKTGRVAQMLSVDVAHPLFTPGFDPALPPLYEAIISQLARGYASAILLDASRSARPDPIAVVSAAPASRRASNEP